jgi:hypothetical protein
MPGRNFVPAGHSLNMKLSQTRKTRSAAIDLGDGQSFTFKYRSFTPNEWDEVDESAKADEDWGLVIKLERLVLETGLEDDNGSPVPPTTEGLREIETPILRAMLEAILGTTLPKKEN